MTQVIFIVLAVLWCLVILYQLRRGSLREKYAVLWIAIGAIVVLVAVLPGLLVRLSQWAGVQVPSNLLFFLAILLLLGVALHLSVEASGLEEETRTLAEEVAILRADVDALRAARDVAPPEAPARPEA